MKAIYILEMTIRNPSDKFPSDYSTEVSKQIIFCFRFLCLELVIPQSRGLLHDLIFFIVKLRISRRLGLLLHHNIKSSPPVISCLQAIYYPLVISYLLAMFYHPTILTSMPLFIIITQYHPLVMPKACTQAMHFLLSLDSIHILLILVSSQ